MDRTGEIFEFYTVDGEVGFVEINHEGKDTVLRVMPDGPPLRFNHEEAGNMDKAIEKDCPNCGEKDTLELGIQEEPPQLWAGCTSCDQAFRVYGGDLLIPGD